jgi:hypothetical protein
MTKVSKVQRRARRALKESEEGGGGGRVGEGKEESKYFTCRRVNEGEGTSGRPDQIVNYNRQK